MMEKYDELKNVSAEPGKVVFRLDHRFQLITEVQSFTIVSHNPDRSLKVFTSVASEFYSIITKILELKEFTRIGLRFTYRQDFPNRREATEAILGTKLIRVPEGKYFGLKSDPLMADYGIRWEENARGFHFRLRVDSREYNFEPPFGWEGVPSEKVEKHSVACDCDFFTTTLTGVSQFSLVDWIDQSLHMMNRDTSHFLGA